MLYNHDHLHRLVGMVASAGLTLTGLIPSGSQIASNLPHWAILVREWSLFIGAPVGLLGMLFYTTSMALDNRRKWREEREHQRAELHEIEDAKCRARQQNGECPRMIK